MNFTDPEWTPSDPSLGELAQQILARMRGETESHGDGVSWEGVLPVRSHEREVELIFGQVGWSR